jgi:hypothetical protein
MLEELHSRFQYHRLTVALVSVSLSSYIVLHSDSLTTLTNFISQALIFTFFLSIFFMSQTRYDFPTNVAKCKRISMEEYEMQSEAYTKIQLKLLRKHPKFIQMWKERGQDITENYLEMLGMNES